jgi:nicotinamide mononucleotide transporter
MNISDWITSHYIEVFGAVTGIVYVILEIRQNIWLWPVGIVTSAVYIWIFFTNKFYADMSLQGYYLVISVFGWYWWRKGAGHRAKGAGHRAKGAEHRAKGAGLKKEWENGRMGEGEIKELAVTRLNFKTGVILAVVCVVLYLIMFFGLSRLTDSPVPEWDSFITSLSIVATWMLARKIYEHWFLWIVVNAVSTALFIWRGLYPTVILYLVYCIMSFVGLVEWKKTIKS